MNRVASPSPRSADIHIPYLQPFEDVNKPVSRLGANIPLIKKNLCPLTFIDVPDKAYIDAMLGVYEMNRVELLKDLFIWACERSELVANIVRGKQLEFLQMIKQYTDENVPEDDRAAFVELVQDEIKRLHPGIIARYRLRQSEFTAWQKARKLRKNI